VDSLYSANLHVIDCPSSTMPIDVTETVSLIGIDIPAIHCVIPATPISMIGAHRHDVS